MADLAIGRNCPNDSTLTACSGSYSDELLVGICAVCRNEVTVANPFWHAANAPVVSDPEEASEAATATDSEETPEEPVPVEIPNMPEPPVYNPPLTIEQASESHDEEPG